MEEGAMKIIHKFLGLKGPVTIPKPKPKPKPKVATASPDIVKRKITQNLLAWEEKRTHWKPTIVIGVAKDQFNKIDPEPLLRQLEQKIGSRYKLRFERDKPQEQVDMNIVCIDGMWSMTDGVFRGSISGTRKGSIVVKYRQDSGKTMLENHPGDYDRRTYLRPYDANAWVDGPVLSNGIFRMDHPLTQLTVDKLATFVRQTAEVKVPRGSKPGIPTVWLRVMFLDDFRDVAPPLVEVARVLENICHLKVFRRTVTDDDEMMDGNIVVASGGPVRADWLGVTDQARNLHLKNFGVLLYHSSASQHKHIPPDSMLVRLEEEARVLGEIDFVYRDGFDMTTDATKRSIYHLRRFITYLLYIRQNPAPEMMWFGASRRGRYEEGRRIVLRVVLGKQALFPKKFLSLVSRKLRKEGISIEYPDPFPVAMSEQVDGNVLVLMAFSPHRVEWQYTEDEVKKHAFQQPGILLYERSDRGPDMAGFPEHLGTWESWKEYNVAYYANPIVGGNGKLVPEHIYTIAAIDIMCEFVRSLITRK